MAFLLILLPHHTQPKPSRTLPSPAPPRESSRPADGQVAHEPSPSQGSCAVAPPVTLQKAYDISSLGPS